MTILHRRIVVKEQENSIHLFWDARSIINCISPNWQCFFSRKKTDNSRQMVFAIEFKIKQTAKVITASYIHFFCFFSVNKVHLKVFFLLLLEKTLIFSQSNDAVKKNANIVKTNFFYPQYFSKGIQLSGEEDGKKILREELPWVLSSVLHRCFQKICFVSCIKVLHFIYSRNMHKLYQVLANKKYITRRKTTASAKNIIENRRTV